MTREAILEAARRVFAERGVRGTSMKGLATAAGVAVQTIYSAFGSKAGVLLALIDLLDREAGVRDLARAIEEAQDPRQALSLFARLRRQIRERCGDIVRTLRSGAALDKGVATLWAEGTGRRRIGLGRAIARLEEAGLLRRGLSAERAVDIAAALVTDEVCDVLVEQASWSYDEYEAWLGEALGALVLEEAGKGALPGTPFPKVGAGGAPGPQEAPAAAAADLGYHERASTSHRIADERNTGLEEGR